MKNSKFFSLKNLLFNIRSSFSRHKGLIFALLLIIISLSGAVYYFYPDSAAGIQYENDTQRSFDDYSSQFFNTQLASDSLSLHFYLLNPGKFDIKDSQPTLGTFSYENLVSGQSFYINEINRLKTFNYKQLSQKQQLTYDTAMEYFKDQLDFADLCLCSENLSPTTGIQAQLPILFAEYQFLQKKDIDNYLSLLSQLKDYFAQICEFQKLKAEKNSFISDFCCEHIISQCREFINVQSLNEHLLCTTFNAKIANAGFLTEKEKSDYANKNLELVQNSAVPAYQLIISTLSDLKKKGLCKNPNGLFYLPNGRDYYEYLTKTYTGSSRSVLELKAEIQTNLVDDMRTMYSILNISPELEEQFYQEPESHMNPKEMLSSLSKSAVADFPISGKINYKLKYVDKSLEDYLSPAFYLSPPIDSPDSNTIYINNGSRSKKQNLYATLAHEGIPGHMFQSHCFAKTNPPLIRHLINYGGYTEGWATYVEFLSYKYQYSNPQLAEALARSSSYSLALYSLCDIGINYEGWTFKDTKKFLANYNLEDEKVCESIFQAVIEEPANYLQYYVGYMEICHLKGSVQKKLGDKFNLKKFHQAFLNIGPTSFSVLDKWMMYEYAKITGD